MLKMSYSPQGIQTMVFRTEKANDRLEPYSQDHRVYSVYKSQRNKGNNGWVCTTEEQNIVSGINAQVASTHRPESDAAN